ncbi:unnamed protein product, partial [Didymodactylos carnosus]
YRVTNDKQCVLVAWKDLKCVLIGSNYVGIEPIVKLARWDKNQQKKVDISAPQIISVYNKHMGGADICYVPYIQYHSDPKSGICGLHRLGRGGNWRLERMFRFKSEIACVLLQRPTLFTKSVLQSVQVDYSSAEPDDENENYSPPNKRSKRESKLSVSDRLRYDGHDHWPTFQPQKVVYVVKMKDVNNERNGYVQNVTVTYVYILHIIVLNLITFKVEKYLFYGLKSVSEIRVLL